MHVGSCNLDLVLVHRKRNTRPTRNDGVWGTRQIVGAEAWVTGVGGVTQEGRVSPATKFGELGEGARRCGVGRGGR
jgi:hypothetical protein